MRILVVDDDELIVHLIQENLRLEGFGTMAAYDGLEALAIIQKEKPDLIILDIMMPQKDGFAVCKEIVPMNIPIIMLTARGDISDKIKGLELGADDYISKPFDSRELMARVKVVLRRSKRTEEKAKDPSLTINYKSKRVLLTGEEIHLTPKEYDLLTLLYKNPETVFTREDLLDRVWGYDFLGDSRTVDIHIQRLRKKLGDNGNYIETVFGSGYRYKGWIK